MLVCQQSEKMPLHFLSMGFQRGGNISSTMSLAQPSATYRDGGHRTPRYKDIISIPISLPKIGYVFLFRLYGLNFFIF